MPAHSTSRLEVGLRDPPANWRDAAAPPELAHFGNEFAQRGKHCLLLVPSVLAPTENNCLINPAHPDYKRIVMREPEPLSYDPRMFQTQYGNRGRAVPSHSPLFCEPDV